MSYTLRIPTKVEYDLASNIAKMNDREMLSFVLDDQNDKVVIADEYHRLPATRAETEHEQIGFRPFLQCDVGLTQVLDGARLSSGLYKFGVIKVNGQPLRGDVVATAPYMKPNTAAKWTGTGPIEFEMVLNDRAYPDSCKVRWIRVPGGFIGDRVLLHTITFRELAFQLDPTLATDLDAFAREHDHYNYVDAREDISDEKETKAFIDDNAMELRRGNILFLQEYLTSFIEDGTDAAKRDAKKLLDRVNWMA